MGSASQIKAGAAYVEITTRDAKLIKGLRRAQQGCHLGEGRLGRRPQAGRPGGRRGPSLCRGHQEGQRHGRDDEQVQRRLREERRGGKEWGDGFAKEVGRSKKQVADFLGNSQDLFVPLGFDPAAATDISKNLTGLAIDLASFNNTADADVMRDLHAAMTGSGEVMKKYGVILSRSRRQTRALKIRHRGRTTPANKKVEARMAIVMRGTTAAQGDAIRSAGGYANQMKRLESNVNDAAVEIGSALLPIITPLITKVSAGVKIFAAFLTTNKELVAIVAKVARRHRARRHRHRRDRNILCCRRRRDRWSGDRAGRRRIRRRHHRQRDCVSNFAHRPGHCRHRRPGRLLPLRIRRHQRDGRKRHRNNRLAIVDYADSIRRHGGGRAHGDIGLAAEVGWAGLHVVWTQGLAWVMDKWEGLRSFLLDGWSRLNEGIASLVIDFWAGLQSAFVAGRETIVGIVIGMAQLVVSALGTLPQSVLDFLGINVNSMKSTLTSMASANATGATKDQAAIEADRKGARNAGRHD